MGPGQDVFPSPLQVLREAERRGLLLAPDFAFIAQLPAAGGRIVARDDYAPPPESFVGVVERPSGAVELWRWRRGERHVKRLHGWSRA